MYASKRDVCPKFGDVDIEENEKSWTDHVPNEEVLVQRVEEKRRLISLIRHGSAIQRVVNQW